MSSSDIFDVLNIKQKSQTPVNSSTPVTTGPSSSSIVNRTPKPQVTGMQRELYNLLGENQPPIMVQATSKFKDRLESNVKPSPWTLAKFKANPHLVLKHWVKGSTALIGEEPQESSFGKFDQHMSLPEFTKEEYESFMGFTDNKDTETKNNDEKDKDTVENDENTNENDKEKENGINNYISEEKTKEWTFEEVEYLFKLCRNYDLNWFVISDRYAFEDSNRSLEEIKAKFYSVSKKYFQSKNAADPLLESLDFPLKKERERKKYLKRLLSRSAAEIAEEEALIIESRKFEMAAKKTLIERESLLRLLDSPNSDKSVAQYLTSQGMSQLYSSLLSDKSRKRKHDSGVPENPWMKQQQQFAQQKQQLQQLHDRKPSLVPPSSEVISDDGAMSVDMSASPRKTKKQKLEQQTALKRKTEVEYAEKLLENFNEEEKKALGITMYGEKLTPGAFLRSTRISTFKPALQNKVNSTLQELKLPVRPAMPSRDVVAKHEELLKHIVTLADLKKTLDKIEAEKAIASK